MSGFALVAVNFSAACYKGDWHLESLGFSLKFRLARLTSPRASSTYP